jgi:2'-5' RNA ligase|uniref:RNA 2',3'-cyclic phosphodiesterase n=1 Tax=Fervidicoccus fontis TaxID=683846 RepID=A0A7J3SKG2_9CREN
MVQLKRVFIAIEVKRPETVARIIEMENSLESLGVPLKVVEPENLHITLAFIGEIEDDHVETVKSAIGEISGKPIMAEFVGVGAFPTVSSPRVIWAGVKKGSEEISQLQRKVELLLKTYRIHFEKERNFIPHLTLARVKGKKDLEKLRAFIEKNAEAYFGEEFFEEVKLKESILTPKGPIYRDLFAQKLRG